MWKESIKNGEIEKGGGHNKVMSELIIWFIFHPGCPFRLYMELEQGEKKSGRKEWEAEDSKGDNRGVGLLHYLLYVPRKEEGWG